ncbi:MAG: Ubiquinone/menaquinone biosynthesis C-methyltransferase UbiE [Anaerolineales bacterium]|nr:Ubiquinone/menaquinone biosynthesis C-methyltransferase UbiE [Anaerolineales bacterium]
MDHLARFLRFFFHHLYHGLAFTYDLVAAAVSFGHWRDWIRAVIPFIEGKRVLELGHGPGHLQRFMLELGLDSAGLDESAQMGRLARRRMAGARLPVCLARGAAQRLPFPAGTFDSVVSTFPSEYIFDERTLREAHRVLKSSGRLIVLPAGWPKNPFLGWLYRATGESPGGTREAAQQNWMRPFYRAGFKTEARILEVQSGTLLILLARKPEENP